MAARIDPIASVAPASATRLTLVRVAFGRWSRLSFTLAVTAVVGCDVAGVVAIDAGVERDASRDPGDDAGFIDAGSVDAGFFDAGFFDAGPRPDAGNCDYPPTPPVRAACEPDADVCDIDHENDDRYIDIRDTYSFIDGDQFVLQVRLDREHFREAPRRTCKMLLVIFEGMLHVNNEHLNGGFVGCYGVPVHDPDELNLPVGQLEGEAVHVYGDPFPFLQVTSVYADARAWDRQQGVRFGPPGVIELRFDRDLVSGLEGPRYNVAVAQVTDHPVESYTDVAVPPGTWIESRGGHIDGANEFDSFGELTCPQVGAVEP